MKKRFLSALLCASMAASQINIMPALARDYDFDDVPTSHWAYETIMQLNDDGVIDGFDDNTFNPDGDVTREQFVKLLVCAVDNVDTDASVYDMTDINEDRWSYVYIADAEENSIIDDSDYPGGSFNPQDLMSRAVAVKWISKSLKVGGSDIQTGIFSDINDSETDFYASELNSYGIINGYDDGNFHPDGALTRAEAATIIKNIMDYLKGWEITDEEKEIVEYEEGVLALDSNRKTNILTKNSTASCEFSNIDDDIKSLKKGDIFVVPNCEKAPGGMAVKVKSVTVRGKNAVITKDDSLKLEEVVQKIDINKTTALTAANIITDELPKGITITDNNSYAMAEGAGYNGDTLTASLEHSVDLNGKYGSDGSFTVNFSDELKLAKGVTVKGAVDISGFVHPWIKFDKKSTQIIDRPNSIINMSVDVTPSITLNCSGEIDDITIGEIPFEIPFEAFSLYGELILKVGASGEVYVTASCNIHDAGTLKYMPTYGDSKPNYRTKEFSVTTDVEAEVSVTITPKVVLRIGVAFLGVDDDASVCSIFAEPEIGLNIKTALNSKAQNHIHHPCLDIGLTPYFSIGAGVSVAGLDFKNWSDIWSHEFNTSKYYAGRAEGKWDFGKGTCPYLEESSEGTYITQFGTENAVSYPKFAFDYSDNWTISEQEVNATGSVLERVVLKNDRGAEITYMQHGQLGGYGKSLTQYEVTKAADAQFVPGYIQDTDYTGLGAFMVGQIKSVGFYDYKTGELIQNDGLASYALLPESFVGMYDGVMGLAGYHETFSFYDGQILFIASPPDGGFNEEETQEVISILSSFRAVD